METKLEEQERWLAATFKSIGDAVIAADERGDVTDKKTDNRNEEE